MMQGRAQHRSQTRRKDRARQGELSKRHDSLIDSLFHSFTYHKGRGEHQDNILKIIFLTVEDDLWKAMNKKNRPAEAKGISI